MISSVLSDARSVDEGSKVKFTALFRVYVRAVVN